MVVEVAQVVTFVSGAAGAVGAVGAASLGIKALLTTFKALRASGLSVRESMDGARRIVETQQYMEQRESMTPEQRQAEKGSQVLTAQDLEDSAWKRHEELKASGFKNELPPSTGHKFF